MYTSTDIELKSLNLFPSMLPWSRHSHYFAQAMAARCHAHAAYIHNILLQIQLVILSAKVWTNQILTFCCNVLDRSAGEDPEDAVQPGGETDAADDDGAPARRGVARDGAGAAPAAAPARRRRQHPAAQGDEPQPPPPPARERRRLLRLLPLQQQQQRRQRQPPELLLAIGVQAKIRRTRLGLRRGRLLVSVDGWQTENRKIGENVSKSLEFFKAV